MNIINLSKIQVKENINLPTNKQKASNKIDSNKLVLEDQVTISKEAKKILKDKKESSLQEMEEELRLIEDFKKEIEASKDEENPYSVELKCILIALRIINGDQVPQKDKKFLMENKPKMYGNATLLKRINKDPKKYKSLIEDEEKDMDLEEISTETAELISQLEDGESVNS